MLKSEDESSVCVKIDIKLPLCAGKDTITVLLGCFGIFLRKILTF